VTVVMVDQTISLDSPKITLIMFTTRIVFQGSNMLHTQLFSLITICHCC